MASSANTYSIWYALNWPDALFDKNGAANWPHDYRFAGEFQADSLDELWSLLNRDDRPNAKVGRSICVGDIVLVIAAASGSSKTFGQMWIARMMGWEELHPSDDVAAFAACDEWPAGFSRESLLAASIIAWQGD
jgi:hypothetical protein